MAKIREEREYQRSLPGSEFDLEHGVNDWISIATHYLAESAKRKGSASFSRGIITTKDEYEASLLKAAAVIVAALSHSDLLKSRGDLA